MKHLYVFYFFTTLLVGIVSLVIAAFIYLKTRDKLVRYSLFFYVPFTLVVVFYSALSYIEANVPLIHQNVVIVLQYFATTSLLALIFVVPVSVHYLSSVPHAAIRNIIFGSIALITYMSYHFIEFVITEETLRRFGENLLQAIFVAVMIYSAITDMYYHRNVQDPVKKRFGKKGAILFGISLPGLFYDMFFSEVSPFRFYPILYCGFSIFFVYYFLTYYSHQSHIPENALPAEDFFEQYNISPREQEIVTLVLKGYSNQKIGETLYISLNTVKAHLRNIYPKFGVKSRYELITLVKDAQGNPSTGTEHSNPQ